MMEYKRQDGWAPATRQNIADGLRVKYLQNVEGAHDGPIAGMEGYIVSIKDGHLSSTQFDNEFQNAHSCGGRTDMRSGWYCDVDEIMVYAAGLKQLQPQVADSIENVEAQ